MLDGLIFGCARGASLPLPREGTPETRVRRYGRHVIAHLRHIRETNALAKPRRRRRDGAG